MRKMKRFAKRCSSFIIAVVVAVSGVVPYTSITEVKAAASDTYDINREISRRFTTESLVLLKNNEKVLPLNADDQVAVFGAVQMNTFKTVFGSGSTSGLGNGFVNTMDTLKTKVNVDAMLESEYRSFAQTNPPNLNTTNIDDELLSERSIPEMNLDDSTVENAAKRNDKAVVFIGRTNGEGYDWKLENEYQLRAEEKQMLNLVTKYFDKVTVVLNTASPIDMSWDNDKIDAILWVGMCGGQGAAAISSVLSGEANPSGKLTQTWAEKYEDTPTYSIYEMKNTPEGLHGPEVEYKDDIYVGYRYYDSYNVTPKFPFGFGLSYTEFETEIADVAVNGETVTVKATVENTGDVAGKEVVQVYYSAPDGELEKPYQELAAFAKTSLLQPKEKQTVTMSFSIRGMASYYEKKAQYVLEDGDYVIRVGNSSRSTHVGAVLRLDKDAVTEQLSNQMEEAIPLDRFTAKNVKSYSYDREAEEIAKAEVIAIRASEIKTENHANQITDEPELLKNSVEADFVKAAAAEYEAKTAAQGNSPAKTAVAASETVDAFAVPGTVHCADLGTGFAGYVENDPSGDVDGYKSVLVQKAGTEMPFTVDLAYNGVYTMTLRYNVDTASRVEVEDQSGKTLCTFELAETGKWATATAANVRLDNVSSMKIVTKNDNIDLNWLTMRAADYAGLVQATLPSGSYRETIYVGLYSEDSTKGTIYYTTDGSEPTENSSCYTDKIPVTEDTTIRAYMVEGGKEPGRKMAFTYNIDSGISTQAVKPVATVIGTDAEGNNKVALRAETGMSVFYTLDGSSPDSNSFYYTEPVSVPTGTTIKAVAVGSGCRYSAVTQITMAEVAAPTANIETESTYTAGQQLTLTAKSGLKIYYTMSTDGTEPEEPTDKSDEYTSAIKLDMVGKNIVKAVAMTSEGIKSETAIFVYQIAEKVYTLADVYAGEATVEQVVAQMNLSELAEVAANSGRSSRFLCPSVSYADGPLGVKTNNFTDWAAPSLLACSWDVDLFAEQGDGIGKEAAETNIDFWLAPGVNILRDPRSGRNSEYYAEDEMLTGVMASSLIRNMQEHNVGCVVKHFVGNDQETKRKRYADAVVSERALREIYLKAFEIVVKTSQPWGLMTTYCDVNRKSTATNFELCTAISRGEWGFDGVIMTDWVCYADNSMMMYAGNELIMPSGNANTIKNAILYPDQVNMADPNYTKPTTKAMLQRNVVHTFDVMIRTSAFARQIGKPQTYDYLAPELRWVSSGKSAVFVPVKAFAGANGSVTPDSQEVQIGGEVKFMVGAAEGYIVDRVNIEPAAAYELDGNTLTVKAVESSTNVAVSFKAIPQTADFDGLNAVIGESDRLISGAVIGKDLGQYLQSTVDKLKKTVEDAKAVAADSEASVETVETAIQKLLEANAAFISEKLKTITHSVTYDGTTKIKAVEYMDASKVIGSEKCSDSDGGQNTTGTYKGTYLTYRVYVDRANVYNLFGRVATTDSDCGYEVYVDGERQGSTVRAQETGGWQNWADTDPVKVSLSQGIHEITIMPTKYGMNVNYFTLERLIRTVEVTTDGNGTAAQKEYQVEGGQDLEIVLSPKDNYIVDTVTTEPAMDYEVYRNTLTLQKIRDDVRVHVTFRELPAQPDTKRLQNRIDEASAKLNEAVFDGTVGNYTLTDGKELQNAIDKAADILVKTDLTAQEAENAIQDLENAIRKFESNRLTARVHIIRSNEAAKIKAMDYSAKTPSIGSEPSGDEDGGHIPIYTEVGTWLEYEVDIDRAGKYQIIPRISTWNAAAGAVVNLDGEEIADYTELPETGGYHNWINGTAKLVELPEGRHTLRIEFVGPDINLNWIQLSYVEAEDIENPTVPEHVKAEGYRGFVQVLWDEASDDNGVEGYIVYRDGIEIGRASGLKYADYDVKEGMVYRYTVEAYDYSGKKSGQSESVQGSADENKTTLPRNGWKFTAYNEISTDPFEHALDGDPDTRWASGIVQEPGIWFQVDMGAEYSFNRIMFSSRNDFPVEYEIYVSGDGANWPDEPIATGAGSGDVTDISVAQQKARYIKLIQTGSSSSWLCVNEINVMNEVIPVAITGIEVEESEAAIKVGDTYQIKASVVPEDTTDSKKLTYQSTNEEVAAVDEDGLVTAKAEGTAEIEITCAREGVEAKSVTITVTKKDGGEDSSADKLGQAAAEAAAKAAEAAKAAKEAAEAAAKAAESSQAAAENQAAMNEIAGQAKAAADAAAEAAAAANKAAVEAAAATANQEVLAEAAEGARSAAELAKDAAQAALELVKEQNNAAAAEAQAAEAARIAAEAAKTAAETQTTTAVAEAKAAKEAAEAARDAAQAQADLAAETGATVKAAAEAARDAAKAAVEAVEKQNSEALLQAANAQARAEAAVQSAQDAVDAFEKQAKDLADQVSLARTQAEQASALATAAKEAADKAQIAADEAKAAALKAQEALEAAQKAAKEQTEAAQKEAENAKARAEAAQAVADAAKKEAEEARQAQKTLEEELTFRLNEVEIKNVKSKAKKKLTVTWKKVKGADGYVVQYAKKSNMKGAKKVTVAKAGAKSATIKGLKSNKQYYVRVRAYKIVDGKKIYTKFSAKKRIRVK